MTNILEEICAAKRQHVAACKQRISENELLTCLPDAPDVRGFIAALKTTIEHGRFGLIAEIKKASPSAGLIREDFTPDFLAKAYEAGGAACLSVLTDAPYFQGDDAYLQQAREACKLPVLRKDFMVDPYQIIESRALGADCILLIMAALSDTQASELIRTAHDCKLDVLVEVHDREELDRAINLGPEMIGINNRNLKTMRVDLATAEELARFIPDSVLPICESGIRTYEDLQRMQKSAISAFLVGESLMREADVTQATKRLLGEANG